MFGWWKNRKVEQSKLVPPPQWPKGEGEGGFGTGRINLGELEVAMVKDFEYLGSHTLGKGTPVSFYRPLSKPDGFFPLAHLVQVDKPPCPRRISYVLVARDISTNITSQPALMAPYRYDLAWYDEGIFVWKPIPWGGYGALGYVVTSFQIESGQLYPKEDAVMCVRLDLFEFYGVADDGFSSDFRTFNTKTPPTACLTPGILMFPKVVPVATLFESSDSCYPGDQRCLKNLNPTHDAAMPNLEQLEALIHHYGPTVYFHPDEVYLPSSVPWFFNNGARLFKPSDMSDGKNDGSEFMLDELNPEEIEHIKHGDLGSAQLYIHVKPAFGGTFTDIDMWIFFPFKVADTITLTRLLNMDVEASHQFAGWEHFTLRINNFDGQLWSMYFSGVDEWVEAPKLKFIEGSNKPIVYSAKGVHATFPNTGTHIRGWTKLGTGVKFEASTSHCFIDASKKYQIISANYLGGVVAEPNWLQNMRDSGSTLMYVNDGWSEFKKITSPLWDITPPRPANMPIHVFPPWNFTAVG